MKSRTFSLISDFSPWHDLPLAVKFKCHENDTPRHYHPDYYELVLVRSGEAVNAMDKGDFSIGAGDFFLIPPGVRHSYLRADGLEIYNILFGQKILDYFKTDVAALTNTHLLFSANGDSAMPLLFHLPEREFLRTIQLLEEIIIEQSGREPGAATAVLSNFLRVVLTFCRSGGMGGGQKGEAPPNYRISQLLTKLNEECEKPWNLAKMAKFTGMSLSSFRQHFLLASGKTPGAFLLELRLRKAAMLLGLGRYAVGEVAVMCGFADSNYFSRQFRKKFNLSPREFAVSATSRRNPEFRTAYESGNLPEK